MKMNIINKGNIHQCTSCQLCAAICPVSAINITLDSDGFYRPVVNDEKCIDCSLCSKICYKYNGISLTTDEQLHSIELLAVSAKDSDILSSTTSGGVAYLLAKKNFEQNNRCVGVVYDGNSDSAKHIIAESDIDIENLKGSKYIQSYTLTAFKELVKNDVDNMTVVFGTPCQIYALDRFLNIKKKRNKFILIDIYCHGCPSLLLWRKYVHKIKNDIGEDNFKQVNFRSKIKGWGNFFVEIKSERHSTFVSNRKNNEFYQLFFSNYMLNEACTDCQLRSTLDYTDLRLGDFWGKCYDHNTKGVSAVTIVTERGRKIFENIKDEVIIKKHEFEDFLPFQSWGKSYQINKIVREHLFEKLRSDVPLSDILHDYYEHQPITYKLKKHLKDVAFCCSPSIINILKKIYHHF